MYESETRTSPKVCDCNLEQRSYELLSWTTSVTDDALPIRNLRMSMKIRWKCSVPACKYVATHRRFCFFPGPSLYTSSFPRSSSHLRCSPRRPRPAMVEPEKAGHEKLPKTTDLDRSGERLTTQKNRRAAAGENPLKWPWVPLAVLACILSRGDLTWRGPRPEVACTGPAEPPSPLAHWRAAARCTRLHGHVGVAERGPQPPPHHPEHRCCAGTPQPAARFH